MGEKWCERGDSNPHALRRQILSLVRLPIPPLSQFSNPMDGCCLDSAILQTHMRRKTDAGSPKLVHRGLLVRGQSYRLNAIELGPLCIAKGEPATSASEPFAAIANTETLPLTLPMVGRPDPTNRNLPEGSTAATIGFGTGADRLNGDPARGVKEPVAELTENASTLVNPAGRYTNDPDGWTAIT